MPEEKTAAELAVSAVLRKLTPKAQRFALWKFARWEDQIEKFEALYSLYLEPEDELLHIKGFIYDTDVEEDEFGSWLILIKVGREDEEPEKVVYVETKAAFEPNLNYQGFKQESRSLDEIKAFWLKGIKKAEEKPPDTHEKPTDPLLLFTFVSDGE
jgi:hypothetical protein